MAETSWENRVVSNSQANIQFTIYIYKEYMIEFVRKIWRSYSHLKKSAKDGSPKYVSK